MQAAWNAFTTLPVFTLVEGTNKYDTLLRLTGTICTGRFSLLESIAFDTGYSGSNGLEPQSWVNGNGTSYIYFGSGEFDGQVIFTYTHENSTMVELSLLTIESILPTFMSFYYLFFVCSFYFFWFLGLSLIISGISPQLLWHPLHAPFGLRQQLRWWALAHLLRLPPTVKVASVACTQTGTLFTATPAAIRYYFISKITNKLENNTGLRWCGKKWFNSTRPCHGSVRQIFGSYTINCSYHPLFCPVMCVRFLTQNRAPWW